MSNYFNFNGKWYPGGSPIAGPQNRGLRYGDGLFETIRLSQHNLLFKELHFQRLFQSMALLKFSIPPHLTPLFLENEVLALCTKNKLSSARIRLMIFRGNGGLYDSDGTHNYCIEATAFDHLPALNQNGLLIDQCPGIRKNCDVLSNIKSNNFLPYTMGALWAKEQKLNDALLLNTYNRVCDCTIANIFMIKNNIITTPPLSEGCIAGVMRQWLLAELPLAGYAVKETPITYDHLCSANEVFCTNVIKGIRWVGKCGIATFTNEVIKKLYALLPGAYRQ